MIDWILENKELLFSGLGVAIVVTGLKIVLRSKKLPRQSQKSGDNSKNIQAGGDITINSGDSDG